MRSQPLSQALRFAGALLLLAAFIAGCDALQEADAPSSDTAATAKTVDGELRMTMRGRVIVANRNAGTASVISTRTDNVILTVNLPQAEGEPLPEPMYVAYDDATDRVFIGDRANNRVVAYDARDASVIGTAPAGGIFHMWVSASGNQLWVVNDIDNEMTVIDPATLDVLATVPVTGGTPHDTIVEPDGSAAYVTLFVADGPDQVVKYDTGTFTEVDRADVGEDPHLGINDIDDQLYVPCQNSNAVFVLNRASLDMVTMIAVPGAHGAWMTRGGRTFFTTNLPGGGASGLFAIDTATNSTAGSIDTTPEGLIPVPHNIASTPGASKIYVTHSGDTASQVTIYTLDENEPMNPDLVTSEVIEVGLNPFGTFYVPSR